MSEGSSNLVTRLMDRVFPRAQDFYGLINEQCDLVVEASEAFVEFMRTGDADHGLKVRALEHKGDELKSRNIDILNRAFSTPMDREDLYRAMVGIDQVVNYQKTTIREMEVLAVKPDSYTLEMSILMRDGAEALQRGFAKLSSNPVEAEPDAQAARKSERNTEKVYRKALAALLDARGYIEHQVLHDPEIKALAKIFEPLGKHGNSVAFALTFVVDTIKRREVYRHLSNSADRVAEAGEVLHDIVVKMA